MDDLAYRIGSALRRRRRMAQLTLRDVSARCGVAVPQLSRIENGLVDPRLSTLVRILGVTGGTLADLAIEPAPVTPIADVLERRKANRTRLRATGIAVSDPMDRLDERDRRGEDTSAERTVLER
ncbi:MAG TPA: helix-turn-helix transcriptional regulator [Acidimicrobiia bacterium]|nr:helix-turn-helix transcriptional regulator [Acidimicrobiia bacterium]